MWKRCARNPCGKTGHETWRHRCTHRLPGRQRENGERNVIVKVLIYKDRKSILQMARNIFYGRFHKNCKRADTSSKINWSPEDIAHHCHITNAEGKRNIYKYDAVTKNTTCVSSNFAEREWERPLPQLPIFQIRIAVLFWLGTLRAFLLSRWYWF